MHHSRQNVKDVATNLMLIAKGSVCHECKRKRLLHNSQYFSKTVHEITEQMEGEDIDMSYFSIIGSDYDSSWNATIQINGQLVVSNWTQEQK